MGLKRLPNGMKLNAYLGVTLILIFAISGCNSGFMKRDMIKIKDNNNNDCGH